MEDKKERELAMACHLLGLIGFIGPLIIWLIKKDESPAVAKHGIESLNFQISIFIYSFIAALTACVFIGVFLLVGLLIFDIVMIIIAANEAKKGVDFRYPLCIRFIK